VTGKDHVTDLLFNCHDSVIFKSAVKPFAQWLRKFFLLLAAPEPRRPGGCRQTLKFGAVAPSPLAIGRMGFTLAAGARLEG
jgi:hypothetical protein